MKKKSFADMPCPIALSLEHVGDWWNILILRDLAYGLSRFDEFQKSLGIAPSTLTRRLNDLIASGLVERRAYSDKPLRYDYLLTETGRDFRPVVLTLMKFGNKHFAPNGTRIQLFDEHTDQAVDLVLTDGNTGKRINFVDHTVRYSGPAESLSAWRVETGRTRREGYCDRLSTSPSTPS
ncbi:MULTISPECIES: helix-turn-helix domain-containing protein [unclassified Pseudomonas]|uniref:winged helix-turn-helix transcriptional regulator n=1 Tax=unclassified Pseudomonas TaxID=196821 RepID=UPI000D3CF36B|nr:MULTISPECIES: helix-turn-helix domain-containing protein [unclassified Pseudomonas]RAU39483.1 transcriptional regulator [Pseudomonas sp. RIT 409]RAU56334.1 transcriptional regulator [Pseudomonas sp. RIT 412]